MVAQSNENKQTWALSLKGVENLRKLMISFRNDGILADHKHDTTIPLKHGGITFELHVDMIARHKILLVERGVWLSQRILERTNAESIIENFKTQVKRQVMLEIFGRYPILIEMIEPEPFRNKMKNAIKEKLNIIAEE